jgi:hypothetical protein
MSEDQQHPASEGVASAAQSSAEAQTGGDRGNAIAALLRQPLLLSGENPHAHAGLVEAVSADVQPADFIETIWIHDIVYYQWQSLRYRRFKTELIRTAKQRGLAAVLKECTCKFEFQMMATEELAWRYVIGIPQAIAEVDELLQEAQLTIDAIFAHGIAESMESIERFDRLIHASEARRDLILGQVYERRELLGAKLRGAIKRIEKGEDFHSEIGPGQKAA